MGRKKLFAVVASIFLLLLFGFGAYAADTTSLEGACNNPNLRPADRAVLKCDDSVSAFGYLKSITTDRAASAPWRVDQLNPDFAICAAKFLKFANDNGKNARITDAVRSYPEQQAACNRFQAGGGIANCNMSTAEHPKGIAIDATSNNPRWMYANAPQFGVVFYLGDTDTVHFVPLSESSLARLKKSYTVGNRGISAETVAAAEAKLQSGSGCLSPGFQPTNVGVPSSPSPTSDFSNAVRQAFGVPIAQPQVAQQAFATQPVSASQNPIQAFEPQEALPASGVSSQIQPTTVPASSTAADRLEQLAFGTTTTSTSTAHVPVVVSASDAAVLTNGSTTAVEVQPIQGVASPVQNTFRSGDLSWEGETSSGPVSGMTAIYITIKAALERILSYLVPFGTRGETPVEYIE